MNPLADNNCGEQIRVTFFDQSRVLYTEGTKRVLIPVQQSVGLTIIYASKVTEWTVGTQQEVLSEAKKQEIIDHVQKVMLFGGSKCVLE
jgi:hypothetical protein